MKITESQLRKIIRESLEEVINGNYDSFDNGDCGHRCYTATVIKFNDGETYVLDETHDDIDEIRKDLKKQGYVEGRDFTVEEQEQREFWNT